MYNRKSIFEEENEKKMKIEEYPKQIADSNDIRLHFMCFAEVSTTIQHIGTQFAYATAFVHLFFVGIFLLIIRQLCLFSFQLCF